MAHGKSRAALDTGRAVADDPVELVLELADDAADADGVEGVLVPRLRGGQKEERLEPLVADQGLVELGVALDDVDEVVDHAALGTHDEVEIAQADVEVDHGDAIAPLRQRRAERRCRCRLADAALA